MDSNGFGLTVWRKSTHSATTHCVEIATAPTVVGMRDSKQPDGLVLHYPVAGWKAFLSGLKAGEFNLR